MIEYFIIDFMVCMFTLHTCMCMNTGVVGSGLLCNYPASSNF